MTHRASSDTWLAHQDHSADDPYGALVAPLHLSTTYAAGGFHYARRDCPNRAQLERSMASLYDAAAAVAFASGLAAIDAVVRSTVTPDRPRIVAHVDAYGGFHELASQVLAPDGVTVTFVDVSDQSHLERELSDDVGLVWIETPTNPLLTCLHISAIADTCAERGIPLGVDNTLATPLMQNPLSHGATVSVDSLTKFVGGHSDALGGCATLSDPVITRRLRSRQGLAGAGLDAWTSWLMTRGLKTLGVRLARQQSNAVAVAQMLRRHPRVCAVNHADPTDGPAWLGSQLHGPASVLSFTTTRDAPSPSDLMSRLRWFATGSSLGAVESLVSHPATMSHRALPEDHPAKPPSRLVRLSLGIEAVADLIADLNTALS